MNAQFKPGAPFLFEFPFRENMIRREDQRPELRPILGVDGYEQPLALLSPTLARRDRS